MLWYEQVRIVVKTVQKRQRKNKYSTIHLARYLLLFTIFPLYFLLFLFSTLRTKLPMILCFQEPYFISYTSCTTILKFQNSIWSTFAIVIILRNPLILPLLWIFKVCLSPPIVIFSNFSPKLQLFLWLQNKGNRYCLSFHTTYSIGTLPSLFTSYND